MKPLLNIRGADGQQTHDFSSLRLKVGQVEGALHRPLPALVPVPHLLRASLQAGAAGLVPSRMLLYLLQPYHQAGHTWGRNSTVSPCCMSASSTHSRVQKPLPMPAA